MAVDGFYPKRPFLRRAKAAGVTVVSRLRKDAALRDLPPVRREGQRNRPRKYGRNRISLAKRATLPTPVTIFFPGVLGVVIQTVVVVAGVLFWGSAVVFVWKLFGSEKARQN